MENANNIDIVLNSEPIVASNEVQRFIKEINLIDRQIKNLENMKSKIQAHIQAFMRDRDLCIDEDGIVLITWKFTKPSVRFDAKKLAEYEPDTYKKYLVKGDAQRRFLIKEGS